MAQEQLKTAESVLEGMFKEHEQLSSCTQEAADELDFKISVAMNESTKWTDYLY